jgi:uncharacterized membrane protein YukC
MTIVLCSEQLDPQLDSGIRSLLTHDNHLFCLSQIVNNTLQAQLLPDEYRLTEFINTASQLDRWLVTVNLIDYYQNFPEHYQGIWSVDNFVVTQSLQVKMGVHGIRQLYYLDESDSDFSRLIVMLYTGQSKPAYLMIRRAPDETFYKTLESSDKFEQTKVLLHNNIQDLRQRHKQSYVSIPRKVGSVIIASLILTFVGFITMTIHVAQLHKETIPRLEADIKGQIAYISGQYADASQALSQYKTEELNRNERVVLANSYVKLEALSDKQKDVIGAELSLASPDLLLNYWIEIGRGEFKKSLNLAQKLDDNQLMLYSYTKLYAQVQLSKEIDGKEKQSLLTDYEDEMSRLAELLKVVKDEG